MQIKEAPVAPLLIYRGGYLIRTWNRACIRWRKGCIRRLAKNYRRAQTIRHFRLCLTAVLSVECFCLAGMVWQKHEPKLSLVRRAEICEMELIPKTKEGSASLENQEIYGIRLDLKALEVQFYHRKDSFR